MIFLNKDSKGKIRVTDKLSSINCDERGYKNKIKIL